MKSFSSILLWLLLIALVAVPSFLFYNWVMQGKEKAAAETTSTGPVANVFPPSQDATPRPAAAPAAQPQAALAQAAAPVQPAPRPAPAPAQQAPAAQPQAAPAPAEQSPSASANAPEPAQALQPEVSTGAEQGVEVSTVPKPRSWYAPKSERDPTFSPADYRKLKEEQMQREEAERLQRYAERNKPREPGPETRINLQGIVGNAALINNEMYYAGQTVRGVKILKVGVDYIIAECVTGSCKGKKFKKVMR
ncbi:MAG: hypothetical protein A2X32_13070 [Elusimicrobia bacterium GWC2_64_44]|nr:MAG: hypothetical protein A2X32_13070 [Elusimicrobia bacterium GWC2_64_44]